jgi:hypothetical protein
MTAYPSVRRSLFHSDPAMLRVSISFRLLLLPL